MILCTGGYEAFSLTEEEYVARYAAHGFNRDYAMFVRTVQRGELDPRVGPID